MCNVIPTASTLVPGRALLASTRGTGPGNGTPRYWHSVMAGGTRSAQVPPAGPAGGTACMRGQRSANGTAGGCAAAGWGAGRTGSLIVPKCGSRKLNMVMRLPIAGRSFGT